MVQRYEQTRKLQWYKRGAAYKKKMKGGEGWWRVILSNLSRNILSHSNLQATDEGWRDFTTSQYDFLSTMQRYKTEAPFSNFSLQPGNTAGKNGEKIKGNGENSREK